ncbi:MAG TPA: lmo0937 family membrane protein [Thermoanaerobaculia bacterium]|jgi:hypothetical protein
MAGILWLIAIVLVVFWVIGAVLDLVGGIIHFVLVAALVVAIFAWLRRKL